MGGKRIVLCLVPLVVGGAGYALLADVTLPIGRFEFAWSGRTAAEIAEGRVGAFRDALAADYLFIAGYTTTILLGCLWGWGRGKAGVAGAVMAVVAAGCDIVENLSLRAGLDDWANAPFERAAVAAGVKFTLVTAASVIAIMGIVRIFRREASLNRPLTGGRFERGRMGTGQRGGATRGATMPKAWSDKRERQYEHIKDSAEERGTSPKRAKEIAARTVNKNRAQAGEAKEASRSSIEDMSPQRRGGLRSGTNRPKGRTKEQLYNEARHRNIKGRSSMTKAELQKALGSKD